MAWAIPDQDRRRRLLPEFFALFTGAFLRHAQTYTTAGDAVAAALWAPPGAVFAALGMLPLVFVTEIGFAVTFGVLLDTFVVRSVLVTALNLDVGRWMWWPSSLHRTHDLELDQLQQEPAVLSR